jgi:hypothetical protein
MTPSTGTIARRTLLLAGAGALAGCAAPEPARYAGEKPALDIRRYFDGLVDAWGVFTDRNGAVARRFTVALRGRWNGEQGVLEEDFVFSDGERQRRVWYLTHLGDGRYTGRADDVVGTATGEQRGNALRWNYTLALPVGGRTWHVDFDDWMFLVDERVLLNRATMSKFGIRLGEVTLAFTKR